MSFRSVLEKNWRRLVKSLGHDERQKLLEILCQEYIEETQNLLQFLRHAARMRYPQFRDRLVSIARQEQGHVQWLQGKIIALGGEVPRISFAPEVGLNSWECLLMDLEEEKRCCADLTERLAIVEHIDIETSEALRRIRKEEEDHREEIVDMLIRSDPQAAWPV